MTGLITTAMNAAYTKIIKAIATAALIVTMATLQILTQTTWAQSSEPGQGDVEAGRAIGQTCAGCHGSSGMRNAYPGFLVPKLGGQHQEYLAAALRAYRAGERAHPTMRAHAGSMSDADIDNIAAYIASLKE